MIDIKNFLNKRTVIIGDVNSGKTQYTLDIIREFLTSDISDIAILDLAPEKVREIGGKMILPETPEILYMTTDIVAPRLTGRNDEEIQMLARKNRQAIEKLFDAYLQSPRDIIVVNDVTLYLHAGTIDRLTELLSTASTQVVNAYCGTSFAESPLTRKERESVDLLLQTCDCVIEL
jgi:predicted ATP-dependent endonuclease of OLD family